MTELRIDPVGLYTARSPVYAPPGALLKADNVVIRTKGTVEPRPGFANVVAPETADEIVGLIPFPVSSNTSDRYLAADGTETLWSTTEGVLQDEDGGELLWESYVGVVSRQSMYIPCEDALRAVHVLNAPVAYRAGVPTPGMTSATPTAQNQNGPALSADGYRAYRAVARRDAQSTGQSHISRGAPSNRLVAYSAAAPVNMTVKVALHQGDDWIAGDVIELYSTEETTAYPTDEMYLNQEVEVTSTHINQGYVNILDDVPDGDLGRALYTNDSREGSEGQHYRPPQAGVVAEYNNSLWLGDLKYPASLFLEYKAHASIISDATDLQLGAHLLTSVGVTNGSPTITGLGAGEIAASKVGMLIYDGVSYKRVTAVGANTLTLNANWAGVTDAAANLAMNDSIRVGSEYYLALWIQEQMRGVESFTAAPSGSSLYTVEYEHDVEGTTHPTASDQRVMRIVISCLLANTAAPGVWATNGHLYTPVLPEPSEATGYTMPQDILPDNVAWSNEDEPDHFRLDNVERVGRSGCRVLALVPSRNALLVFTDKGTWRASGRADSGIAFDEVDPDARILGRLCAAELNGRVYMWGDAAVYDCDENECRDISTGVISDLDEIGKTIATARESQAKVIANPKNDEILVLVPEDGSGPPITHAMVFNQHTGAWTKWTFAHELNDAVCMPRSRLLRLAPIGLSGPLVQLERTREADTFDTADDDYSVTVSAVTGASVTIAAGSGWTPVVGDVLRKGGVDYILTAAADATHFTVHTTGLTTGDAEAYTGIACVIAPTVNVKKYPTGMKLWGEGSIWWNMYAGVHQVVLGFQSSISGGSTTTSRTRTLASTPGSNRDAGSKANVWRFLTPRAAARSTHLTITLSIRQARSRWEYDGIAAKCRLYGDRVKSRLG